jgi:deoxyribonuclease V
MVPAVRFHSWSVTPEQAVRIQRWLAGRVRCESPEEPPRLVCGLDVACRGDTASAAAVLWDAVRGVVVDERLATTRVQFPYLPGLLAFREVPALLAVLAQMPALPDALLCDGHGLAHPRRFGLASHVGLLLGLPTAGCAKQVLCGSFDEPADEVGASSSLMDRGEMIGRVVRTRAGSRPLFVSAGHLMGPACAEQLALACCRGCRVPEPLRLADALARRGLKSGVPQAERRAARR